MRRGVSPNPSAEGQSQAAVDNAIAAKYAYRPEDIQGENIDGFLLWIRYGVEGDHVAVVERELDAEYQP